MPKSTSTDLITNQLNTLMTTSHDAIICKTLEGIITDWNPGAERLYGYTLQEIIGKPISIIIPPHCQNDFFTILEKLKRGEIISRYETQRRSKDGRMLAISLSISPLKDQQGDIVGALSIAHDVTLQKQNLTLLQQREEHFARLAAVIPQLIWTTQPDGQVEYFNQRWYDYAGLSVEETVGWGWQQIIHPEDLPSTLDIWRQALKDGHTYEVEYRLKRASDGSYRWHLARGVPLRDTHGAITQWFGTCTDIDAWKRTEILARQSEERFRLVVEHSRELICMMTTEDTLVYVSPSYQQVLGYVPQTLVHQSYLELLHPDDHTLFLTHQNIDSPLQFRMRHADGSWCWMEGSWSYLLWQEQQYIVGIGHDITERKQLDQLNEELRLSGERFKSFINANIIGVIVSDEMSLLEANDTFLDLLGYSREELECKHINWPMMAPPEYAATSLKRVEELRIHGSIAPSEQEYVRKDGTHVPLLVGAARLQEEPLQWITFVLDLTILKTLEHQLEAKNTVLQEQYLRIEKANRLKNEFLANMSHELRTPLNAIIGFTDLLATGIIVPALEAQQEYLGDILTSARHLLQLVNDILDLSKLQSGKLVFQPEPVSLKILVANIRDIMRPLAANKQIRIETQIDPDLNTIVIDPARFKQVFYNYLSNAIKFTPQEGQIHVYVKAELPTTFRLEVQDTGIGIAPEDVERLFVEFQQLDISTSKKYQGTGLGLALTKRLVEAQEGQVGVSSQPGQGSTFFAILPRIMKPIQRDPAEPDPSLHITTSLGAPTLLIIEDEVQDQQQLARICTQAGYNVEIAPTGAQALKLCRTHAFAAVTLDLFLPDLDGLDILRVIRSGGINQDVPVIVITLVEEKGATAGFMIQGTLTKPIQAEEVLEMLNQLNPVRNPTPAKEPTYE